MLVVQRTVEDYTAALLALLPPGEAWQWPVGGAGLSLLTATAQELVRVDSQVQGVLDLAIDRHRIKSTKWSLAEYLNVARSSQLGDAAKKSIDAKRLQPFSVGSHVGDRCWSAGARFILWVTYDASLVTAEALWQALLAFKQAHIYLWVVDQNGSPLKGWHVQN
ncbi:hypothetical protein [Limnohabitans sp.]|uniref:hypothetical protein n=1 Tax=Limnohabitans sp. TaxID=1907725 RepID=UPI00286F363C|nr:hypothetical protein [Limnohabitans sp.]